MDRFISSAKCQCIHLDQELDRRIDRVQYKDREEKCNVCLKDNQIIEEAEALQQAYIAKEDEMLAGIERQSSTSPNSSIDIQDNIDIQDSSIESPNIHNTLSLSNSSNLFVDLFEIQQAQQQEQRQSIQKQNQQEGQEVQELEQQLEEQKGQYALCFVYSIKDNTHSIQECHQDRANDVREALQSIVDNITDRNKKRFKNFLGCFWCHIL